MTIIVHTIVTSIVNDFIIFGALWGVVFCKVGVFGGVGLCRADMLSLCYFHMLAYSSYY